jgi:hypothetical protein
MGCCLATCSSAWSNEDPALTSGRSCGGGFDLIQQNAKEAAELGPVLETIGNALRADQAKMIDSE